jgi:hypothetical protein
LRRSPHYRAAAHGAQSDAEAGCFGLHRFERSELGVAQARPIWRADADPFVLAASASAAFDGPGLFDLARIRHYASVARGFDGYEHWLFSDGFRAIRLDVGGTLTKGSVELEFHIAGLAAARPQLLALQQLIGLVRTGRFLSAQFPVERRARRWGLLLRVHDASAAGASQREIAAALFGRDAVSGWQEGALSYRSRVRRLQNSARHFARSDPRLWLSGAL